MSWWKRWVIGIGVAAFAISLVFNWIEASAIQRFTISAQGNLMEGEGLIRLADGSLLNGKLGNAAVWANQGIGYLQASSADMSALGVQGISGLAIYFNQALFALEGHSNVGQPAVSAAEKKHYQHVLQTFLKNFQPFVRVNYGSLNNYKIQQAINGVYQAMTPTERKSYEGWGTY